MDLGQFLIEATKERLESSIRLSWGAFRELESESEGIGLETPRFEGIDGSDSCWRRSPAGKSNVPKADVEVNGGSVYQEPPCGTDSSNPGDEVGALLNGLNVLERCHMGESCDEDGVNEGFWKAFHDIWAVNECWLRAINGRFSVVLFSNVSRSWARHVALTLGADRAPGGKLTRNFKLIPSHNSGTLEHEAW